jgi:MutS domain III
MRRSTPRKQRRDCHCSVRPSLSSAPANPAERGILGTLNNTRTTLGRSLLRTWLLRPSLSLEVISARHDAVECFTRPENLDIADVMHSQLVGIQNIPRILSALGAGKATIANWQGLVKVSLKLRMVALRRHIRTTGTLKVHVPHRDAPGQARGAEHGRGRRYRQEGLHGVVYMPLVYN